MAKPAKNRRAENLALYERLVSTKPDVERKGDTMPYTSVNGHMFSLLTKDDGVILRLPTGERESFLKKYKTTAPVLYGAVMKEYVDVPDALLKKTSELKKYFDLSYSYVSALKPKATAKKKKAK